MHIPTHILSGWCVGNLFALSPGQRLCCMIAAAAADVDGVGIVFGEEAYWALHHKLGHNVFFGLLLSAGLTISSRRRRGGLFLLYLLLFHLHLLMDYFGSGPGWMIHYLWPADHRGWKTDLAWPLSSWQNYLAFGVLLAWTVLIARKRRRTPLEMLAPRLDGILLRRPSASAIQK